MSKLFLELTSSSGDSVMVNVDNILTVHTEKYADIETVWNSVVTMNGPCKVYVRETYTKIIEKMSNFNGLAGGWTSVYDD